MLCAHCGAPLDRAAVSNGACHFCKTAIAPPAAQPAGSSIEHGIAEILRSVAAGQTGGRTMTVTTSNVYVANGVTYTSLDQMPADVRQQIEGRLAALDALLGNNH